MLLVTSDECQNSDYTSNQTVSILHPSKRGAIIHIWVLMWQNMSIFSWPACYTGTVYGTAKQMTWSSGKAIFTMAGVTF